MSFCFDVWYRHRGSKKMPARIREAFQQGHDIVVRYRNKRQSVCMRPGCWERSIFLHYNTSLDIMEYKIQKGRSYSQITIQQFINN